MLVKVKRVLLRRVPYAVLSWRYLLTPSSDAMLLHRYACFRGIPNINPRLWLVLLLYSNLAWFSFWSWYFLVKVARYQIFSHRCVAHTPRLKQLADVIRLALGMTTPPQYYYQYKLFNYPRKQWWDFIYTHEVSCWHQITHRNIGEESRRCMQNKLDFYANGKQHKLPVVDSTHLTDLSQLLERLAMTPLFIKPVIGSRKQHCYQVSQTDVAPTYRVKDDSSELFFTAAEFGHWVNDLKRSRAYLYQPLLNNHNSLVQLAQTERLITFRVITFCAHSTPYVVSAVLEWPLDNGFMVPLRVDIHSGDITLVASMATNLSPDHAAIVQQLDGKLLTMWQRLKDTALDAHRGFSDIPTIGWDLVCTEQGVQLLEGNLNWGVAPHQLVGPELMPAFISLTQHSRTIL